MAVLALVWQCRLRDTSTHRDVDHDSALQLHQHCGELDSVELVLTLSLKLCDFLQDYVFNRFGHALKLLLKIGA